MFRFGDKHFGAAYYLCDECHILNIFGVTVWGEGNLVDMGIFIHRKSDAY